MAADRPPDRPSGGPPGRGPGRAASPVIHRLWRVGGSLAAVGILGLGTMEAVSQLAHEEETFVREVDGAGLRRVEVDNGAGAVHVVGTEGDDVTIQARVSHGLRATGHSERVVGDRLVLEASCPLIGSDFCSVTYTLEVPEDVAVEVRGESTITVSDIAGPVEASTDNGSVEAARIAGDVRLESDNGRVVGTDLTAAAAHASSDNGRVELGFLDPPSAVEATSDNGRVEVVLPNEPDVYYVVDVSTDNGTAATPDIRTDPESERTVTAGSDNGNVTVRYAS